MALPDVLKLLGNAIVADAGPDQYAEMVRAWPGLAEDERDDLLKIPHERLHPYQSDFYAFESDMVQWGFEHTWKALQSIGFAEDGNAHAFMVRFKAAHPSRTHSVREMGRHFVAFLNERCLAIREALPWIVDLAKMERLEIEVLYAMDNPLGRPLDGVALDAFFGRELGAVLDTQVVRAESVATLTSAYDLPELKTVIRNSTGERIELVPAPETMQWLIARDHADLSPVWYRTTGLEATLVSGVPENSPIALESLAERFVELRGAESGAPQDDEALLGEFLALAHRAFTRRYFLQA